MFIPMGKSFMYIPVNNLSNGWVSTEVGLGICFLLVLLIIVLVYLVIKM